VTPRPLPGSDPPATSDIRAADRIRRMFGRFVAAGYAAYLFFISPIALAEAHLTASWWMPTAMTAVFGTGLALGAVTFLPDVRWVSRLAAANAIAFLVAALLWWPAWTGESSPTTSWQSMIPGIAGLAAVAAWRPRPVLGYLAVSVLVVQTTNLVLVRDTTGYHFVPELAFSLMFCGVFAVAAIVALRTGNLLDSTIATAQESVVAAAAARAKTVERERFDALVHDQVMSTLLAAGRDGADEMLAAQARRALATFDALRRGDEPEERFDVEQVLARLRSAASDVDEDTDFTVETGDAAGGYPPEPVRVIAEALSEAVRNSVRHAGPGARRALHVDLGPDSIRVVVRDDGRGFDPRAVDPHRMGIRASIRGRLNRLPGGWADIASTPDVGTTVTLTWTDTGTTADDLRGVLPAARLVP